ncbi:hypothetical protein SAMN02745216_02253 [Desulfatibacillum alkenivorans DSM 16219]|uniref:Dockerin domain-containing protein n=2 Tax=Desulfatibacillum alkenivorans TaxID=259354 RepID=A0A1M6M6H0_9BACT|nr:hypothetical protein SAMN02745216_02253 [Desulfatibacillum alkenivorans DSM 16219]
MTMTSKLVSNLYFWSVGAIVLAACIVLPGTSFAFTCDSGDLNGTCVISSTQLMANGEVISGAGDLIIADGGSLTTNAGESFSIAMDGDVVIESGGSIAGNLSSLTAANLTLESGGSINANGKGYAGGLGPEPGVSVHSYKQGAGGGGYGGSGGNGQTGEGGDVYGSVTTPSDFGSGGGNGSCYPGGAGGGALILDVPGTLSLDGSITSNGGDGSGGASCYRDSGGGAGGSIWINTGTLDGEGSISANGGGGGGAYGGGGGGGGGRIAVYSTTDTSAIDMQAYGGWSKWQWGAAGVIYTKSASQAYGDLIVDNNDISAPGTNQVLTTTLTLDNITLRNSGNYVVQESCGLSIEGVFTGCNSSGNLTNNGAVTLTSSTVLSNVTFTNNGTVYGLENLDLTSSAAFYSNGVFDALSDLTVGAGSTVEFQNLTADKPITITNVMVLDTGAITHEANGATQDQILNLHVTGDLDVQAGGSIHASLKGYSGGYGPEAGGAADYYKEGAGGGGYGGRGGDGTMGDGATIGLGGAEYGSVETPSDIGSAGGNGSCYPGGAGGGAVLLDVSGTFTLNGTVAANGGDGSGGASCYRDSGGGAGGSVLITANSLAGSGSITANGGAGGGAYAGAGGGAGGRIAVYSTTDTSALTMEAYGGWSKRQYGGAGAIYTKTGSATLGDLLIDNNGIATFATTQVLTTTLLLNNLTVKNMGYYVVPESSSLSIEGDFTDCTTSGSFTNNGVVTLPVSTVLTNVVFYNNGDIFGPTDLDLASGTSFYSNGNFDALTDLTIGSGATFEFQNIAPDKPFSLGNITVRNSGVLTHKANGSTRENILYLHVANNVDVQAGGSISVDAKGYATGAGPGAGATGDGYAGGAGGAGHAGAGGNGSTGAGGDAYGTLTSPEELGSGGGYCTQYAFSGGAGGGAIRMVISGTLTLDGSITSNGANGANGQYASAGGGAGGSIWITANNLEGNGSLYANGGNGIPWYGHGGGGGGGRIQIDADADSSSLTKLAIGGTGFQTGEIGTIYPIPPKAITSFMIESLSAIGEIDEDAKSVTLTAPYGTSLMGLTPTIAITGVSVSPASGAAQDFTDGVPVTYTVTAYDTSTQDYGVTINLDPPSSNNTITSAVYTISAGGTANETIVNVPFGISLADFLAALTAGDAYQSWDSSDLTDPVISRQELIVTAQDGTSVTYIVYINLTPGDVNHDGLVAMEDLILSIQATAGLETAAPVYGNADVNGDGVLGLTDSLYIMREVLK